LAVGVKAEEKRGQKKLAERKSEKAKKRMLGQSEKRSGGPLYGGPGSTKNRIGGERRG